MSMNPYVGLRKNSRSPGSITNMEHHDATGAQKNIDGTPSTIKSVIADSTVSTPLCSFSMVRVCNTDTVPQFIWFGKEGDEPVSLDVTNSFALPAGYCDIFHIGASNDEKKSIVVQSSDSKVQVIVIES